MISDNATAIILSMIALIGNVIVAWLSHRRDCALQEGIDNANDHPKDENVVELLRQNETLHAMVKKLLIKKGRTEQIAIENLGRVAFDNTKQEPPEQKAKIERPRRVGVIRGRNTKYAGPEQASLSVTDTEA